MGKRVVNRLFGHGKLANNLIIICRFKVNALILHSEIKHCFTNKNKEHEYQG